LELDCVLLGLIRLHQGVTGYELSRTLRESTGYLMSVSLSHIYPALRRLHERGLVTYKSVPMTNRPEKKVYQITPGGEQALQVWLEAPVEFSLDLKPFFLKMAFSPLMTKDTILAHIDREIARVEYPERPQERGVHMEMEYLDKDRLDPQKAEMLWNGMYNILVRVQSVQLEGLKEWRVNLVKELKD
jgi:DNA-binding PadR family transcriptional regulator